MLVLYRKQLDKIAARKVRLAVWLQAYTGRMAILPHPYLRSFRLVWSSSARPGTLVANHVPFNSHH